MDNKTSFFRNHIMNLNNVFYRHYCTVKSNTRCFNKIQTDVSLTFVQAQQGILLQLPLVVRCGGVRGAIINLITADSALTSLAFTLTH